MRIYSLEQFGQCFSLDIADITLQVREERDRSYGRDVLEVLFFPALSLFTRRRTEALYDLRSLRSLTEEGRDPRAVAFYTLSQFSTLRAYGTKQDDGRGREIIPSL